MPISLRNLTAKDTFTMREVALDRGFAYLPFSFRELITPQLQFGQDAFPEGNDTFPDNRPGGAPDEPPDDRPGQQSALESDSVRWANWLDDFVEDPATRLEPTDRTELRQAMVNMLDVDGGDAEVRSVGSGHSHSNAAEPSNSFLDLSRMKGTLSHNDWLVEIDPEEAQSTGVTRIRHPEPNKRFKKQNLVRVRAGTVLKRLNREILPNHGDTEKTPPGKALKNMGSWDGQTLAGAINTGTHGTGIRLGSLADVVQSVEIATVPEARSGVPIVQLYRIEPAGGITDREKFEAATGEHEMELIQDDDVFYSTVVGYGCLGNVVAYTIRVEDAYWLQELTQTWQWQDADSSVLGQEGLKTKLEDNPRTNFLAEDPGPVEVRRTRHTSFLLNLPGTQDEKVNVDGSIAPGTDNPYCLVRRRKPVPAETEPSDWPSGKDWPPERKNSGFVHWAQDFAQKAFTPYPLGNNPTGNMPAADLGKFFRENVFTDDYFNTNQSRGNLSPFTEGYFDTASYIALRRRPDEGTMDEPAPPVIDAITTEVAVPLSDVTEAVESVIEVARETGTKFNGTFRGLFFVAPLGVRFVDRSRHHMSPEYHPDPDSATEPMALLEVPLPTVPYFASDIDEDDLDSSEGWSKAPAGQPSISKGEMRDTLAKPGLSRMEGRLVSEFDGRPHMGKHFTLDKTDLADLYPRFEGEGSWMETYERFNAFGTFNNAFTDQLGISRDHRDLPDPPTISSPVELPLADIQGPGESETSTTGSSTTETSKTETGETTEGEDGEEGVEIDLSGPGFGVLTGLSALGGYAWWRQRDADESDPATDDE